MDMEQISGSSDLYNKADNVLAVSKEQDEDRKQQGISGNVAVIKNRDFSDIVTVETFYDENTGLLLEIEKETNNIMGYTFGWDGREKMKGFQAVITEDCPF